MMSSLPFPTLKFAQTVAAQKSSSILATSSIPSGDGKKSGEKPLARFMIYGAVTILSEFFGGHTLEFLKVRAKSHFMPPFLDHE